MMNLLPKLSSISDDLCRIFSIKIQGWTNSSGNFANCCSGYAVSFMQLHEIMQKSAIFFKKYGYL